MGMYHMGMAAEFHVLSMLHRLGFTANLTLGSQKAVDIVITMESGNIMTIDVKGIRGKTSWPIKGALSQTVFCEAPGKDACVVSLEATKVLVTNSQEAGVDGEIVQID